MKTQQRRRINHYRVYFTYAPESYFSLPAKNKKAAVKQAKNYASPFDGRRKLVVHKIERLMRNGNVALMS